MENHENTDCNLASSLCTAGCGFFGSAQFDGQCSKCFKDSVKRKNAAPDAPSSGHASPSLSSALEAAGIDTAALGAAVASSSMPDTTPSVETATPTIPTPEVAKVIDEPASPAEPTKSKKRNRCLTCKKKVGLTGFECRCGGLFCSLHRYSDKHECQFDYKKEAEEQIRKNNPVVIGQKVQKL